MEGINEKTLVFSAVNNIELNLYKNKSLFLWLHSTFCYSFGFRSFIVRLYTLETLNKGCVGGRN